MTNPTQAELEALAPLVDRAHVAVAAERRLPQWNEDEAKAFGRDAASPLEEDPDTSLEATEEWALESLARSAENWRKRYVAEREIVNDLNAALLKRERRSLVENAAWCAIVVGMSAALWWGW